ncbi:MAG: hypothetical protein IKV43_01985, partial [Clostridia bacterium]|nr:hypothetical protein [Clostridia bacterium]
RYPKTAGSGKSICFPAEVRITEYNTPFLRAFMVVLSRLSIGFSGKDFLFLNFYGGEKNAK